MAFDPTTASDFQPAVRRFDPSQPHFDLTSEGQMSYVDPSGSEQASPYESLVRGAVQGATMDFGDEIYGGLAAILNPKSWKRGLGNSYVTNRDEVRANNEAAQKAHPGFYLGGEAAGGVLPMMIPGFAPVKGAKLGYNALNIGKGAALTAAGATEANPISDTIQFATDVAAGGALGAGLGAGLGAAANKLGSLAQEGRLFNQAAQKMGNLLFDLPDEYVQKLIDPKTASKMLNPKSPFDIAEGVADIANQIGKDAKNGSDMAISFLSSDPTKNSVSVSALKKKIENLMLGSRIAYVDKTTEELVPSNLARASFEKMKSAIDELDLRSAANRGKRLSEIETKRFIQDLDNMIDWSNPELKSSNGMLRKVRRIVDARLKRKNPDYEKNMTMVDMQMNQLDRLKRDFNLKPTGDTNLGVEISDTTITKINNMFDQKLNPKRPMAEANLTNSSFPYGQDLAEDARISMIDSRSNTGVANGFRNTGFGSVVGSGIGGPVGMVAGAVAGFVKDKYGRALGKGALKALGPGIEAADKYVQPIAQNIAKSPWGAPISNMGYAAGRGLGASWGTTQLDRLREHGIPVEKIAGTKYESPLMQAIEQGPQKLATTHYVLSQKDPDYAALVADNDNQDLSYR